MVNKLKAQGKLKALLNVSDKKYILYVANSALHHNHLNLLTAYTHFIKNSQSFYKLIFVMDIVDKRHYKVITNYIVQSKISQIKDLVRL